MQNDKAKNMANPKHEIRNSKQMTMTQNQNSKHYDLEERTLQFAKVYQKHSFLKRLGSN